MSEALLVAAIRRFGLAQLAEHRALPPQHVSEIRLIIFLLEQSDGVVEVRERLGGVPELFRRTSHLDKLSRLVQGRQWHPAFRTVRYITFRPSRKGSSYWTTGASTSTQTPEMRIQRDRSTSADLAGGASLDCSVRLGLVGPMTLPHPTVTTAPTISAR